MGVSTVATKLCKFYHSVMPLTVFGLICGIFTKTQELFTLAHGMIDFNKF